MKNHLILAVDKSNLKEAKSLCLEVKNDIGFFKLGLEFFYAFGKEGVNEIAKIGVPIFLDLKLHDIPNTVLKSSISLLKNLEGIAMLTLHASGGVEMLQKTNEALKQEFKQKPMIFGVTVLTSTGEFDPWNGKKVIFPFALGILRAINKLEKLQADENIKKFIITRISAMVEVANSTLNYWLHISPKEKERIDEVNKHFKENPLINHLNLQLECDYKDEGFFKKNFLSGGIVNQVVHLSNIAYKSGIEGVVCSPLEAKLIKTFFPEIKIITPGIRPKWYEVADDQSRTLTPKEAINQGADYLVIGRPITQNANPQEAIKRTLFEMQS